MNRRDFFKNGLLFLGGIFLGLLFPEVQRRLRKEGEGKGPVLISEACSICGGCVPVCPVGAIEFPYPFLLIHQEKCIRCRNCEMVCPVRAIKIR